MASRSRIPLLALLAVSLPLAGSCVAIDIGEDRLDGNGIPATEVRDVAPFDSVDIRNAFAASVHVDTGSAAGLIVHADENLISLVETYVQGTTLVVDIEGSVHTELGLQVAVSANDLVAAKATNAVALVVTGLDADAFEIEASNSSTAVLDGQVDDLDARALNASAVTADGLTAHAAFAEALNASSLSLCVTDDVEGTAVNSSHIAVHCTPATSDVSTDVGSSLDLE